MNGKNFLEKIQSDINKSNAKIINNNDNTSLIKKTFNSKYTEDISDSEDEDLVSYKNRNNKMLNDLPSVNSSLSKTKSIKKTKNIKSTPKNTKSTKNDLDSELPNPNDEYNNESDIDSDIDSEAEYEYTDEFKKKVKDGCK